MRNIFFYLTFMLIGFPFISNAQTEISVAGTNIGIGTTSQSNALSINNTLAIGGVGYTSTTAPTNGAIIQGNVGIGSFSPVLELDVGGTVRMTGFSLTTNPSSGYVLTSNGVGIGTWMPSSGGGGSGTVTSVTLATPNTTLTLGGTNPVTVSGTINADLNLGNNNTWTGQQIFNSQNVGIGSNHPGQLLDVQGSIRANTLTATSAGVSSTTGNLGVGISNPGQALDVSGTVRASLGIIDLGIGTSSLSHVCISSSNNTLVTCL